jgi:hypothetical protein
MRYIFILAYDLIFLVVRIKPSLLQVISIKDIIRPPRRENFNDVYIVYELMDTDLHHLLRSNQTLTDDHCQVWSFAIITCLLFMFFPQIRGPEKLKVC